MEYSEIIALINYIGVDKVACLIFDNSSRKIFKQGEFNLSSINETLKCFVFEDKDIKLRTFKTYKPFSVLQGIIGVDDPVLLDQIDSRYFSP